MFVESTNSLTEREWYYHNRRKSRMLSQWHFLVAQPLGEGKTRGNESHFKHSLLAQAFANTKREYILKRKAPAHQWKVTKSLLRTHHNSPFLTWFRQSRWSLLLGMVSYKVCDRIRFQVLNRLKCFIADTHLVLVFTDFSLIPIAYGCFKGTWGFES